MAPIDPKMLLKALNPLLGKNGCIKGIPEAEKISTLMKNANKMVSQCVYITVLKATTEEEVINKFIESGGWEILYSWLLEAKKGSNNSLLTELLKVYVKMPVTIELLKQNSCAKTIKSVSKSSEDEEIKKMSSEIVDRWMKTIRGDSSDTSTSKKKKKKSDAADDTENRKNGEKSKHHHHHKDHKDRRNSDEKKDSSKNPSDSSNKQENADNASRERPKTVKLHNSKFRSTGLELDVELPKVIKKKTEPAKTVKRPV